MAGRSSRAQHSSPGTPGNVPVGDPQGRNRDAPWNRRIFHRRGVGHSDADPVGALNAVGRGLVIAQDSGNRAVASVLADRLALLEVEHGDTLAAFDHLTLAIRDFHNAGDTTTIHVPLAVLAVLFDRLGRYEPAATVAGFALSPMAAAGFPEFTAAITHLRDVLGEATYEQLAHKGETMTTTAMATYAYDQIDQARTELEHPS